MTRVMLWTLVIACRGVFEAYMYCVPVVRSDTLSRTLLA